MNCKDCIHQTACFDWCRGFGQEAELCEHFSDKSEWIHLPCKVGDVAYCYEPCFDADHTPKLKVVEKEIVELKTIATVFGLNFDVKSIGKTVFLTREEAEKALTERSKK